MARTRLSPLDASFLYLDKPHQRMHVGCLALLDGPVPFDAFTDAIGERLATIARYRQVPVRPLLDLDWPRWQTDPSFDVRRHVRHVAVPSPGRDVELHELVDTLFALPLDGDRPLWETYLIDGVADGRSAILCKVHHAMIDGVSGAQLLEAMADPVPGPSHAAVPAPRPPGVRPALFAGLRPSALLGLARDAAEAAGTFASFVFQPSSTLPFNGRITDTRRIVWSSFALDDFFAVRGAAGCKVNDVVLAVITGALRRYVIARGVKTDGLRVRTLVPVSIRRAEEHLTLGNLVTAMVPELPVAIADPIERLRLIGMEMARLKERGQPRATGLALQLAGKLPSAVNALAARLMPDGSPLNTVCTNVPGPRESRELLGRRILEVHPMVPLFSGMGLEFAIMSYASTVSICAAADPHLVPDVGDIPSHLQASMRELRDALAAPQPAAATPRPAARGPRVADLMTAPAIALDPGDSLAKAYTDMRRHRIRHLPVVDPVGHVVGLVSHRDVLAATSSSLMVPAEAERVRLLGLARAVDVMETHVCVAAADDPAADAGTRMLRHKIGCLPVVDPRGCLVGIVTEEDFLRWATSRMAPVAEPARASA